MSRNKLQLLIIAALLLSNIMLVSYLLINRGSERKRPREIIIERLKLDQNQVTEYELLIEKHQSQMRANRNAVMSLKNKLYSTLKTGEKNYPTDDLYIDIGKIQADFEAVHFDHFKEIRRLCRDDQMDEYNQLVDELAGLFSPPRPPHKAKR